MARRTISAYADEKTADQVERIAKIEDRPPAQIAAAALRLYVRLPAEAHAALRRIEALGTEADLDGAASEAARAIIDAQYEIAHRRLVEAMPESAVSGLHDEESLLAEAVRLTKR